MKANHNYKNIFKRNKITETVCNNLLFTIILLNLLFITSNLYCETKPVSASVMVNQNGKINKINLDYINNVRYIDIKKIPNNIIENSQYNPTNYSITSKEFKIQFLPGSFYYTIENMDEVKIVQMYMPIIAKVVNQKTQLIIPFVSFVKSLDSIGLYDITFDNNTINIKSKVTKNEFSVNFPIKFPKLNIDQNDLTAIEKLNNLNQDYIQSEMIDEDFWDENNENIANENYNKSNELNDNLENNEIASAINNIAAKVFGSIKAMDQTSNNITYDMEENKISSGSKSSVKSSGNSRFKSYFRPKYARRKAYTDPFLELRPVSENDNINFKVYKGENETNDNKNINEEEESKSNIKSLKSNKKKLVDIEDKDIESEESDDNTEINKEINKEIKAEEQKNNSKPQKGLKGNYFIPKNLKRPGIDF